MTADKASWCCLPAEIRISVLEILLQDDCSLAGFATVSREWQTIISGLELEEYDCTECAPEDRELWGFSDADDILITTAFLNLFSTLSAWEPDGNLLLDISVHSPSDSEHWFKYLTFEPDLPSDECERRRRAQQSMLVKFDDHQHGWIAGSRDSAPSDVAIHKVFDEIMGEGPFDDDEQEKHLWQQLPLESCCPYYGRFWAHNKRQPLVYLFGPSKQHWLYPHQYEGGI
ncbi:hypothetical protein DTO271G3_4668 [Paecilomyces variotii]|nr:hypothetical protein DTO271G3_4668 [Paecilomyces variotii]